jgi:hypothetical protein
MDSQQDPKQTSPVVGELKIEADELWKLSWTYIRTVIDTLREPFLILDANLKVLSANRTFFNFFQVDPEQTEGRMVYDLGDGQWNIPTLKKLLEEILPKNTFFRDYRVEHDFPSIGIKIIILNARRVFVAGVDQPIIMLAMEDITKQVQLEDQLKEYSQNLNAEVSKRTAELEARVNELESMIRFMNKAAEAK